MVDITEVAPGGNSRVPKRKHLPNCTVRGGREGQGLGGSGSKGRAQAPSEGSRGAAQGGEDGQGDSHGNMSHDTAFR